MIRALRLAALLMLFGVGLASAGTVSINLAWDPDTLDIQGNPLTDLAGYTIYEATHDFNVNGVWISTATAQADSSITKINVSPTTTAYTVTGLSDNTQYYFRLTAFDAIGQQSGFNLNSSNADMEIAFRLAVSPAPPRNLILK